MVFFQFQFLVKDVPNVVLDRVQPVVAFYSQTVRLVLRIEIKSEITLKLVVACEYYVYLLTRVDFVTKISPRYTFQCLQLVHHVRTQDFTVFVAAEEIWQVVLVAFVYGLQPFCCNGWIPFLEFVRTSKYTKILKIRIVYHNKKFSFILVHINKILFEADNY